MSFLLRTTRFAPRSLPQTRQFTTSRLLAVKVDPEFIRQITAAEKKLTNSDNPIKRGPTAKAQAHAFQELTAQVIQEIAAGEKLITNSDDPVAGGPTSFAQSILTSSSSSSSGGNTTGNAGGSGILDSNVMSQITAAEKNITGQDGPVRDGPTAAAQRHSGERLSSEMISDINAGEQNIVGAEDKLKGGPTATAQKMMSSTSSSSGTTSSTTTTTSNASRAASNNNTEQHTGHLDSSTMSKITDAEKEITGANGPVQGGPTARAQQHANEPITSQALHDITEGEKAITGGERVKGGPTSTAQSELGKSRN